MSEILDQPAVLLALMGVLAMIFGLMRIRREKMDTSVLINSALLLALAVVLEQLRIFHCLWDDQYVAGPLYTAPGTGIV